MYVSFMTNYTIRDKAKLVYFEHHQKVILGYIHDIQTAELLSAHNFSVTY